MKCLAVNTATQTLSVALMEEDRLLHLFRTPETRDQGNVLLGHITRGLDDAGFSFPDIDVLAVVTGPGSFTGIRIGLAAMRGIAMAAKKPLVGLSSFDMFAARQHDAINIVAVESWREELYFAVLDEEGHPLIGCMNETPEIFFSRFHHELPVAGRIIISGDARKTVAPFFAKAEAIEKEQDASDVARLALCKFKKEGSVLKPVPYYLREADVTISTKIARTVKGF